MTALYRRHAHEQSRSPASAKVRLFALANCGMAGAELADFLPCATLAADLPLTSCQFISERDLAADPNRWGRTDARIHHHKDLYRAWR